MEAPVQVSCRRTAPGYAVSAPTVLLWAPPPACAPAGRRRWGQQ